MARLAVVGSYGVGITVRLERLPAAGETVLGRSVTTSHGGKGSNQAVGASRLGAQVDLLTALGDDDQAVAARRMWAGEGVRAVVRTDAGAGTMSGVILVEPDGENRIVVAPGALELLSPADVEAFAPTVAAADVCVTGLEIPAEAAVAALEVAHRAGVPTVLDPAPARPVPAGAWQELATYLTPNLGEARALTGSTATDPTDVLDELCAACAGTVVVTLGGRGAVWGRGRERGAVPAVPVRRVVDTTGAGDAFTAAFAVAVAQGRDVREAVEVAVAAGAYAVGVAEVLPGLATAAQLAAFRAAAGSLPPEPPTATQTFPTAATVAPTPTPQEHP